MTKKRHLFLNSIGRFLTTFLSFVIVSTIILGLSGTAFAAEVKGARLLIVVQGEDGYRVPDLPLSYLPPNALSGTEPSPLGSTDARGELVFTDLEEGEFQFFYNVPNIKGRVRVPYTIKDINGRPTLTISDPRLKGDKDAETVEDSAQVLEIVGFQVVDAQGYPVSNAKLAFWICPSVDCGGRSADGHELVFTTITDREGNCAKSGLPTGNYHIEATVYDEYHQEQFSEMTVITIAREDDGQTRTIPLSNSRAAAEPPERGVLSIFFQDEEGLPQSDIRVGYQEPERDEDFWLGCTNAEGKTAISDLKKGTYTFFYYLDADNNKAANRTDFEFTVEDTAALDSITVNVPITGYSGGVYCSPLNKWKMKELMEKSEQETNIQIGFAEEIYGKDVPEAAISVYDRDDQPMAGAKVEVYGISPYNVGGDTTGEAKLMALSYADENGRVSFSNCRSGLWKVRIYCKDELQKEQLMGETTLIVLDEPTTLTWNLYADGSIKR